MTSDTLLHFLTIQFSKRSLQEARSALSAGGATPLLDPPCHGAEIFATGVLEGS